MIGTLIVFAGVAALVLTFAVLIVMDRLPSES
jgi:hypothetical protein